jgi:vacuolar protein sorting-associated protein 13A/C
MLFTAHLFYPFYQWLKGFFFSLLNLQITGYFLGLVPKSSDGVVKLKDNVTNSEKWVSKTDMEGSPALKLDVSFSRPIIVMPHDTNSHE